MADAEIIPFPPSFDETKRQAIAVYEKLTAAIDQLRVDYEPQDIGVAVYMLAKDVDLNDDEVTEALAVMAEECLEEIDEDESPDDDDPDDGEHLEVV